MTHCTTDLLDAALRAAEAHGWRTFTRDQVAAEAKCSPGLVSLRLGTMDAMRRAVMRRAVSRGAVPVVAEGLAVRNPHAMRAPETLRREAAQWLIGESK